MARHPKTSPPAGSPANAEQGAHALMPLVLKLFHRADGDAADWELIAGSLFKVGLHALDKMPEDRRIAFIERLQQRFYERIEAAGKIDAAPSNSLPSAADPASSNTVSMKSMRPKPPR